MNKTQNFEYVISYLDSPEWIDFVSDVLKTDTSFADRNITIGTITNLIHAGSVTINETIRHYGYIRIVELFLENPSLGFLVYLLIDCQSCNDHSKRVLKHLVLKNQDVLIGINAYKKSFYPNHKNYLMLIDFVIGVIDGYQNKQILEFLFLFDIRDIMIRVLMYDNKESISYIVNSMLSKPNGQELFPEFVKIASDSGRKIFINCVLDTLEELGFSNQEYSELFGIIFSPCYSNIIELLVERSKTHESQFTKFQIEQIGMPLSAPLQSAINNKPIEENVQDDILIKQLNQFEKNGKIPDYLLQMAIIDKIHLNKVVIPKMLTLSAKHPSMSRLIEALMAERLVLTRPIKNYLSYVKSLANTDEKMETVGFCIEEGMKTGEVTSLDFFDAIYSAVFRRHRNDQKHFFFQIYNRIFKNLSEITKLKIASDAFQGLFKCSEELNRLTLCSLLLRLEYSDNIPQLFKIGMKLEMIILETFHEASKTSSDSFECTKYDMYNNENSVFFDPRIILRLRWRALRGDTHSTTPFINDFVGKVADDPTLFLNWESLEPNPANFSQTMEKIGLLKNNEIDIGLLPTLLSMNSDRRLFVVKSLQHIASKSKYIVKIGPQTNMEYLFFLPSINESEILFNPFVLRYLRSLPKLPSEYFARFSSGNDYREFFSTHPLIYSIILREVIENRTSFSKNGLVEEGKLILISNGFKTNERFVAFGVTFVAYMKKMDFVNTFADNSPILMISCLFFALCAGFYRDCVQIVQRNPDIIDFLLSNVPEDGIFCEKGVWVQSLISFALFCSKESISIHNTAKWLKFLQRVGEENWGNKKMSDHDTILQFSSYMIKLTQ